MSYKEPSFESSSSSAPDAERGEWRGMSDAEVEEARRVVEAINLKQTRDGRRSSQESETSPRTFAERHPDAPHFKINYDPGVHGTIDDFANFAQRLSESDAYIVEGGGQDGAEKARILQGFSDADPKTYPDDFLDDYFKRNNMVGSQMEAVIRALYGSRKLVGSFDVRGDDVALGKRIAASIKHEAPDYSLDGLDAVTADFAAKIRQSAELQRQRESIMVGQVEPELERIAGLAKTRPEFKDRAELRIYAPMGSTHITLFEDLAASELELDISTEIPPDEHFTYRDELRRFFMAGGQEPSRDLQQRAYVEYVITQKLGAKLFKTDDIRLASTEDFNMYVRNAASKFSEIDIKYVFNTERADPFTIQRMDRELKNQGLGEMPGNNEELRVAADKIRQRLSSKGSR